MYLNIFYCNILTTYRDVFKYNHSSLKQILSKAGIEYLYAHKVRKPSIQVVLKGETKIDSFKVTLYKR